MKFFTWTMIFLVVMMGSGVILSCSLIFTLLYEIYIEEVNLWSAYALLVMVTPLAIYSLVQFIRMCRECVNEWREEIIEDIMRS